MDGGCKLYRILTPGTTVKSPDSSLCLGLGNKSTLVKVRETLFFRLNAPENK